MMRESIETVIIGAGQAGMATSYFLKQHGREHIVLEKGDRPAPVWRNERWDSFTFVTPNWSFRLPGGEYDGVDPDGFMPRDELVARFDNYAENHRLPIAYQTEVKSVQPLDGGGFSVRAGETEYRARNVVVANGWFGVCKKPSYAPSIPQDLLQLRSVEYRNPHALPPGAVLLVGTGQSGAQIAEELYQSGRRVFLATGTAPHAPRRYRGNDLIKWLVRSGFTQQNYEQLSFLGKGFVTFLVSGKDGGRTLNLHAFHRDGVILLGHSLGYAGGKMIFAGDLQENLRKADMGQMHVLDYIDAFIEREGLDAPSEDRPTLCDGYQARDITELDLRAEGIQTIIWACGYEYDAAMLHFSVLGQYGLPDAPNGISRSYPGLFFVGFPFLPSFSTGILAGVAPCAARIAESIHGRMVGGQPA